MSKDFLTSEFKETFTQSLFDNYNIKCHSIQKIKVETIDRSDFIDYSFNGYLDDKSLKGSLNLILRDDGTCHFTVACWFGERRSPDFVDYILQNNNTYLKAINDVIDWLTSNFGNYIDIQVGCSWIGRGSFSYSRGLISNIIINMTPTTRGKIRLVSLPKYRHFHLLSYYFFEKDNQSYFNYKTSTDDHSCSPINVADNHVDLDTFKARFVREYMLTYAQLTKKPNLLSLDDFNTLSYDHIIGYLTVQQMESI